MTLTASPGIARRVGRMRPPAVEEVITFSGDGCHEMQSRLHRLVTSTSNPRWIVSKEDSDERDGNCSLDRARR